VCDRVRRRSGCGRAGRGDYCRGRRLRAFGRCLGCCRLLRFGRSVGWRLDLSGCGLGGGVGRGRKIVCFGWFVSIEFWLLNDLGFGKERWSYFLISTGVAPTGTSSIS
jgi:hypothetical protein